jgi:hypothetical protein
MVAPEFWLRMKPGRVHSHKLACLTSVNTIKIGTWVAKTAIWVATERRNTGLDSKLQFYIKQDDTRLPHSSQARH